ncbi:MAG: WD40 repeat domain-containing protein [Myxococcota bacterium]
MRGALLAVALASVAGCRTLPRTPDAVLASLAAEPGAWLSGTPVALGPPTVLNREDFVYDAKLSADGATAAVSRLGLESFHLTLHDLATGRPRADVAVNALEFDVEALEFSPDGQLIAAVSRDGALRLYSTASGALVGAWLTDEPLVSVAWHPAGSALALGSAKGLVTIVAHPSMQHVAELRAHADEVRAVAFTRAGELVTAGWDRKLRVFALTETTLPPREVRTRYSKKNGLVTFRAVLDRLASATVVLDARAPLLLVRSALAAAVGLEPLKLTDSVQVPTAFGTQLAKVAKGRALSVKNLTLQGVDVAICDACVPADAQAVLGGPVLQQLATAFDESTAELVLTVGEAATQVALSTAKQLEPVREFVLPAPVNDLSLDAKGLVAGVALSETKAERTKAVYDREKKGEVEPEREWDCAARVDLQTGQVLETKRGHRGVVATVGLSPDGATLATGGWDKKVILHGATDVVDDTFGWAVRRVRFSRDGRWLIVAAWTPQNPLGNHQSDPAAVVREVLYERATTAR